MSIEQEYIALALRLFPHMPKCGEHLGNGNDWSYSKHVFRLDQAQTEPLYRIRCDTCGVIRKLPQGVEWPRFWKEYWVPEPGEVVSNEA